MILALDMATKKTGWALFNYADGGLVDYGVIRTESDETKDRMEEIYFRISEKIKTYPKITTIVFEDVPLNNHNNLKTGKDLSILQGVILSLCFEYSLDYALYNPSAWRSIIGLYNGTREGMKRDYQKKAAVDKVNELYGLDFVYNETETKSRFTDDDKAEAICLGLAYLKENKED
jgi:Holliday junction resolvasome RuvABC endonuclease subunit